MARQWYKLASAVLGALIGSACGDDGGGAGGGGTGGTGASGGTAGSGMVTEYGMPMARFIVSGTVVAEDGGEPIEAIEVSLENEMPPATTDANGEFTLDINSIGFCSGTPCDADLTGTDVDGPANGGEFETTTVPISLDQTDPGSGTWDLGTWEAHGVEIQMPEAAGGGGGAGGSTGGAGGGNAGGGGA